MKMLPYQYWKSNCGDKTVVRSSYLHNVISYTGKKTSLYWLRTLGFMFIGTFFYNHINQLEISAHSFTVIKVEGNKSINLSHCPWQICTGFLNHIRCLASKRSGKSVKLMEFDQSFYIWLTEQWFKCSNLVYVIYCTLHTEYRVNSRHSLETTNLCQFAYAGSIDQENITMTILFF